MYVLGFVLLLRHVAANAIDETTQQPHAALFLLLVVGNERNDSQCKIFNTMTHLGSHSD